MIHAKVFRYWAIPLVAILTFWLGGFFYFKSSSDWQEIQALLAKDPAVRAQVGELKEISLAPLPFAYRFSGGNAKATLRVTVTGSNGEYRGTIDAENRDGAWSLVL